MPYQQCVTLKIPLFKVESCGEYLAKSEHFYHKSIN